MLLKIFRIITFKVITLDVSLHHNFYLKNFLLKIIKIKHKISPKLYTCNNNRNNKHKVMCTMSLRILQVKYIISIHHRINLNGKNQQNKMYKFYQKKLIIIRIKRRLQITIPQLRFLVRIMIIMLMY